MPWRKSHKARDSEPRSHVEVMEYLPMSLEARNGVHGASVSMSESRRPSKHEQGSLELGMTRRLRRTMSSVPFKPPFKEPVR